MTPAHVREWVQVASEAFLREAERTQWSFLEALLAASGAGSASYPRWGPPVNIIEAEDSLWVVAALPGVAEEDIQACLEAGILVLSGRRRPREEWTTGSLHVLEVPSGAFERRVRLPQGQQYEIEEMDLYQGLFTVKLRRVS